MLMQVDALRDFPDLASHLGEAIEAIRDGEDASQPLAEVRRFLEGSTIIRRRLTSWSAMWEESVMRPRGRSDLWPPQPIRRATSHSRPSHRQRAGRADPSLGPQGTSRAPGGEPRAASPAAPRASPPRPGVPLDVGPVRGGRLGERPGHRRQPDRHDRPLHRTARGAPRKHRARSGAGRSSSTRSCGLPATSPSRSPNRSGPTCGTTSTAAVSSSWTTTTTTSTESSTRRPTRKSPGSSAPTPSRRSPTTTRFYTKFFEFDRGPPSTAHELNGWGDNLLHRHLFGVFRGDRIGLLYSSKDYTSEWSFGPDTKRFIAVDPTRFGVNLVVYALTT